jgi:hypothetical protein
MRRRNLDEDQTIGRGKLPNARTHLKDFVKRHGRVDFFNLRYVRCEMRVGELILPRDVANKSLKTSRREEGKASLCANFKAVQAPGACGREIFSRLLLFLDVPFKILFPDLGDPFRDETFSF